MDNLIKKYLHAWEVEEDHLLKEVLTPGFKGIRTFFEEKLYTLKDALFVLNNPRHLKYQILSVEHFNTYSYVDAYMIVNDDNEELVTIKFTYKNNLIDSVFETKKLQDKKRIMCICTYDGSIFDGYQKQPTGNTVQDTIEKALYQITKKHIQIHSSGRTDKGVHAYNQVFHFDTDSKIPDHKFKDVLNSYLDDGIYIKSSKHVHETFHSRYDIQSKEYLYKFNKKEYDCIMRQYEWHPEQVDYEILKKEISSIVGEHDFTSLTKTNDKSNIRTIYDVYFEENSHYLYVFIKGNGFLRYMVRNIIGAAVTIAQEKTAYTLQDIVNKKDNTIIKDIAPASGLYMNEVVYND